MRKQAIKPSRPPMLSPRGLLAFGLIVLSVFQAPVSGEAQTVEIELDLSIEQAMRGATARFPEASTLSGNPTVTFMEDTTPEAAQHALRISRKAYEDVVIRKGAWESFKMTLELAKAAFDVHGIPYASTAVDIALLWADSSSPDDFWRAVAKLGVEKGLEEGVSLLVDEAAGMAADKVAGVVYDKFFEVVSAQVLDVTGKNPLCGSIPISAWFTRGEDGSSQVRFAISGDCGCEIPEGDPVKLGAFSVYGSIPATLERSDDRPESLRFMLSRTGSFRISAQHTCDEDEAPPEEPVVPSPDDPLPVVERICRKQCEDARVEEHTAAFAHGRSVLEHQRIVAEMTPIETKLRNREAWIEELEGELAEGGSSLARGEIRRLQTLLDKAESEAQAYRHELEPLKQSLLEAESTQRLAVQRLQVTRGNLGECMRRCYAQAPASDKAPSLTLNRTVMRPGQDFQTSYVSLWGHEQGAWIGMHQAHLATPTGADGQRQVLERRDLGGDVREPEISVSGSITWSAPEEEGAYEMRLFSGTTASSIPAAVAAFEVRDEQASESDAPPPDPEQPSDSGPPIRVVKKTLEYISPRKFRPVWWLVDESGSPVGRDVALQALQTRTFRDDPSNVWEHKVPLTIYPGGIATYEWYWNASRSWGDVATFRWTLLEDGYRFTADSIDSEIALD